MEIPHAFIGTGDGNTKMILAQRNVVINTEETLPVSRTKKGYFNMVSLQDRREMIATTLLEYEKEGGEIRVMEDAEKGVILIILADTAICPNHSKEDAQFASIDSVCSRCKEKE